MALPSNITNAAAAAQGPSNRAVPGAQGIYSSFPMASAKYAKHFSRDTDYYDTMARMYVEVSSKEYETFIRNIPDPETQKVLQVLAGDGTDARGKGYIDFLLQSVQQSFQENSQVSETLADNYVAYFFGQAPPVFQFSGILMNTYQDDWTMRMLRLYRDIGRGSQLARHKKLLTITYDSIIVRGAMMNINWANTAELQTACQFSFNFLVKELIIIPERVGIALPSRPASLLNVGGAPAPLGTPPTTSTAAVGDVTGVTPPGAATADPYAEINAAADYTIAELNLNPTTDQVIAASQADMRDVTALLAQTEIALSASGTGTVLPPVVASENYVPATRTYP
jgi:hypothetical protein